MFIVIIINCVSHFGQYKNKHIKMTNESYLSANFESGVVESNATASSSGGGFSPYYIHTTPVYSRITLPSPLFIDRKDLPLSEQLDTFMYVCVCVCSSKTEPTFSGSHASIPCRNNLNFFFFLAGFAASSCVIIFYLDVCWQSVVVVIDKRKEEETCKRWKRPSVKSIQNFRFISSVFINELSSFTDGAWAGQVYY
jgi:hypothetical protein